MNGKSTYTIVPPLVRPVQDEWGLYDPDQAGLQAAMRAVDALNLPTPHPSAPESRAHKNPPEVVTRTARDEEVYELTVPEPEPTPAVKAPIKGGAVYTLEFSTPCPECRKMISTVRVSRLLRTQVSFTSTLPRKGYIIVCPECDGMLSAELSGLV